MTIAIESRLDALLAPLDELAREPLHTPSPRETERAYCLALLSAELTCGGAPLYLMACARHLDIAPEDALTIARAFSSAIVRVAQAMRG